MTDSDHISTDGHVYTVHCPRHGTVALGVRDRIDAINTWARHLDTFTHDDLQEGHSS